MRNVPPPWLVRAITRCADVLAKLRRRLLPAPFAALELGTMSWVSLAVAAFCELGLPDALADGAYTPDELADKGFGEQARLFRLLRALAGYGVVRYAGKGRFTLGYAGLGLVGDNSMGAMIRYANAPWHLQAYTQLAQAVRTQRSGFELSQGKSMFEYLTSDQSAGVTFDAAMQSLTSLYAPALAQAYDFSRFARIVDIGGGSGSVLATILGRFRRVRGTLFELPAVAQRARERGMSERIDVVEGDIRVDVPPPADAYILSHVLHDWDDDSCVRMLQNVRRALGAAARVLVFEIVAPPPNNSWSQDRITDLEMLAMLSGRERTREDFAALFARAGLWLRRIVPTSAPESILEGVPTAGSG